MIAFFDVFCSESVDPAEGEDSSPVWFVALTDGEGHWDEPECYCNNLLEAEEEAARLNNEGGS